jgi:hypothetical protein
MVSSQTDKAATDRPRDAGAETLDPVVCACANLTLSQLNRFISEAKDQSFEGLLAATSAGQTCTACLLDLEYHYSVTPQSAPATGPSIGPAVARGSDRLGAKQQLWALLDRLSPPVARLRKQWLPVISGKGIETRVCVTNHPLLFNGVTAPPLRVRVQQWNADGGLVMDRWTRVLAGDEFRLPLKPSDASGNDPLSVGSALVTSRALTPGPRGTTRPQIELLAPAGACAVHTQAATGPGDTWFTMAWRPADERLFLSIINPSTQPLNATISYPHGEHTDGGAIRCPVCVPAKGGRLHEIRLDTENAALADPVFSVRIACDGMNKVHLLCATPSLDRFSIDHP